MKKKILPTIVFLACVFFASAQLRYGISLGCGFTHPTGKDIENVTIQGGSGFIGGLQLEYQLPMNGLAFGIATLYEHRPMNLNMVSETDEPGKFSEKCGGDFIAIPIEIKYKFDIGLFHNLISPYVLTGPDLAVRLKQAQGSSLHTGWDVGAGIDLVNFIQISGGYRFGLNKIYGLRDNGAFLKFGILFDF